METSEFLKVRQVKRFLRDEGDFAEYLETFTGSQLSERDLWPRGLPRTMLNKEDSHPMSFLWDNVFVNYCLKGWREKNDAQRIMAHERAVALQDLYVAGRKDFLQRILFQYKFAKQCIEKQDFRLTIHWATCLKDYLRHHCSTYFGEYEKFNINGERMCDVLARINDLLEFIEPQLVPEEAENKGLQIGIMEAQI